MIESLLGEIKMRNFTSEHRANISAAMKAAYANGMSTEHRESLKQGQRRRYDEINVKLALLDQLLAEKASATT